MLSLRLIIVATVLSGGALACSPQTHAKSATDSEQPAAPELNDANHRAAANQLLQRMNMDKLFDTIIETSIKSMTRVAPNSRAAAMIEEWMRQILDPNAMMEDLVSIYVRNFTQRELESLVAFYSTDLGKKLIAKMPELTREGAELGQRRVREHLPELMAKMKAEFGEQKQQNTTPPPDSTQL